MLQMPNKKDIKSWVLNEYPEGKLPSVRNAYIKYMLSEEIYGLLKPEQWSQNSMCVLALEQVCKPGTVVECIDILTDLDRSLKWRCVRGALRYDISLDVIKLLRVGFPKYKHLYEDIVTMHCNKNYEVFKTLYFEVEESYNRKEFELKISEQIAPLLLGAGFPKSGDYIIVETEKQPNLSAKGYNRDDFCLVYKREQWFHRVTSLNAVIKLFSKLCESEYKVANTAIIEKNRIAKITTGGSCSVDGSFKIQVEIIPDEDYENIDPYIESVALAYNEQLAKARKNDFINKYKLHNPGAVGLAMISLYESKYISNKEKTPFE